jgi:hypothetical protein
MILATHGIIGSSIVQFTGLLDTYSGAEAAYSLRKLRTAYTGNAIRVRRASDNAEQDIAFVSNILDTSSLTTFCSGTNGFITTWYDQSGNGRNATQTTAANQPQIVSSGSVILENGKPSIKFDGNNDFLEFSSNLFLGASSRSVLIVYKPDNATGTFTYSLFGQSGSNTNGNYTVIQSRTQFVTGDPYFAGFSQDLGNGLTTPNVLQKLAQFNYDGTTGYLYKNNSLLTSANITLNALSTGKIYIGAVNFNGTIAEFSNAKIQECVAWQSNQNSNNSGISSNINSFYSIY